MTIHPDTKGASTSSAAPPADVQALAEQLDSARGRLALLHGDAATVLSEVPSEAELAAERDLAEWRRERLRESQRAELSEQLAAAESLRRAAKTIRDADIRDAIDARKALAEQRRADTPASTVAELHRYSRWTRTGCGAIITAGMVWSAINVQQNMAPGGPGDPLFWASYLIEAMISGLLIILALGTAKVREAAGIQPSPGTRWAEAGLFLLTLGLNTYPYVRTGQWYEAALHAVAPVLIGATLIALHYLGKDYATARAEVAKRITGAEAEIALPTLETVHTVQPTVPALHGAGPGNPVAAPGTVHRAAERVPSTVHGPRTSTVHPAETAQPSASDTVETEQFPSSPAPRTAHPDTTTRPGTEQHGEQPEPVDTAVAWPDPDASVQASDTVEDSGTPVASAVADEVAGAATVQNPDSAPTGEDAAAAVTEHPQADTVQAPKRGPSSRAARTVQSPSTVHPGARGQTVHRAPLPPTVQPGRETVHSGGGAQAVHRAPAPVTAKQPGAEDDAELWALASDVHARLRRTKFSVEDIARVLIAHRRHGLGVDRIYRDKLGPHRETTGKWIELAGQIETERTGQMAPVITLKRGHDRP